MIFCGINEIKNENAARLFRADLLDKKLERSSFFSLRQGRAEESPLGEIVILAGMIPRWIKAWFAAASPRVTARSEDQAPRGEWACVVVGSTLVVVLALSVVAWMWWDRLAQR